MKPVGYGKEFQISDVPTGQTGLVSQAPDLGVWYGGVMRIRRVTIIIIPAILALGVAAAAMSGSESSAVARHAPSVRVEVPVVTTDPGIMFHG
jgi:hypothetical protein